MTQSETTSAAGGPLWCMHIQGPDDLHAAPDFWTALAWAAELNSFIAEKAAKGNWKADDNYPLSQAVVRQWTGTPESHAVQCEIELADRAEHEAKRKAAAPTAKGGTEVPAGWKLVPEKPTAEMLAACWDLMGIAPTLREQIEKQGKSFYRKMLAASPPPPAGAAGGGSGDLGALSAGATFTCAARKGNTGANDPQECDWPVCGCDPHADKVIAALQESGRLIEAPTPDLGAQGEPVAENVAQIIAHDLCGYVDEVDAENFLNVALTTAQKILALVSSTSKTPRSVWVKAYEAECQRTRADFSAQACLAEDFPQIVAPQQPAAQGDPVAREAILAVVRAAWALVDNTGHHDWLPLAINRDDWNDLAARLAALKVLLPAEELPADPPHAVAYFWPTSSSIDTEPTPDLGAQGEPVAREVVAGKIQAIAEQWRGANGGICTIRAMSLEMADLFLALIAHADRGGSDA